jgi:ligand-binding sensor domain-containing protein
MCFVVLVLHCTTSGAAEKIFSHLGVSDGLPASTVRCLYQDSKGFMWFGTESGGLCKYDGYAFTVYKNDVNDSTSIASNWVYCIFEDSFENLWIGTISGLDRFNRAEETFTHFVENRQSPYGLSDKWVTTIFEDNDRRLWIGTRRGLNEFNRLDSTFTQYVFPKENDPLWKNYEVKAIYQDQSHNLLIGTRTRGLCHVDKSNQRLFYGENDNDVLRELQSEIITAVSESESRLWVGTANGLYEYDAKRQRVALHKHQSDNHNSLLDNYITCLTIDPDGNVWIGSDAGLCIYSPALNRFERYSMDPRYSGALQSNYIRSIYQDRGGIVWIATKFGGISRWVPKRTVFNFRSTDSFGLDESNLVFVQALLKDTAGTLWIGTRSHGLFRYKTDEQKFERVPWLGQHVRPPAIVSLASFSHWIWIGSNKGLARFDPVAGTSFHYPALDGLPVNDMITDSFGKLWLGTSKGLYRYNADADTFESYLNEKNSPGQARRVMISSLVEREPGLLWLGTSFKGVLKINTNLDTFEHYRFDAEKINSPINDMIRALLLDRDGTLWIGTKEGLNVFDPETEKFELFRERDGLPSNTILGLAQDRDGFIWISTNNGLSSFDPQSRAFTNFDESMGCPITNFLSGAAATSENEMFFGGINGFASFFPDSLRQQATRKNTRPVIFTSFKIFDRVIDRDIAEHRDIDLSYHDNYFSFEFAHLDYINPAKNQFAYKLDGLDSTWIFCGDRRYVNYTLLPPGDYAFHVKAANAAGVWTNRGIRLDIHIAPPFWGRWWFRVFIFGLVVLLFAHLRRYYVQKHNAVEARLRARQAQLEMLRYQINPHFLFNALNSIMAMVYESRDNAVSMLRELSHLLRYSLSKKSQDMVLLKDDMDAVRRYLNIEKYRFEERLETRITIEPAAESCYIPSFFIQPLVENAIKHGKQSSKILNIDIQARLRGTALYLDIANTGRLNPNNQKQNSFGIGLQNVKRRLDLLYPNQYTLDLVEREKRVHVLIEIKNVKRQNL